MSYNVPKNIEVIKSPLINLKSTGNTILFTPLKPFVITEIITYGFDVTGVIGGVLANIGWTPANYDDIFSGFSAFTSTQGNLNFTGTGTIPPEYPAIPANTPIQIKITSADATATTNSQYMYLNGYYL